MYILIFTEVDGSLLNRGDDSCEEARPALERIARGEGPDGPRP